MNPEQAMKAALVDLTNESCFSSTLATIPTYSGKPADLEDWLLNVDTMYSVVQNGALTIRAALLKSQGCVKDHIKTYLETTNRTTVSWTTLRKELDEKYGLPSDKSTEQMKLR